MRRLSKLHLWRKKLDDLEQYARKVTLEIFGIPEEQDEALEKTVIQLTECMEIDKT